MVRVLQPSCTLATHELCGNKAKLANPAVVAAAAVACGMTGQLASCLCLPAFVQPYITSFAQDQNRVQRFDRVTRDSIASTDLKGMARPHLVCKICSLASEK